jgi:outer membrane scaffolding protein for murein synthesis (MipA/OmpV family)
MNCRSGLGSTHLSFAVLLVTVLGILPADAESRAIEGSANGKPLWEAGVGGFAATLPDYPAAGQNTFRALPVPILIYRGNILRVGGEGNRGAISGRFVDNDQYEFDVSLSAAFPVDSDSNKARRDMPDLDFLLGFGPQLIIKLINEPGERKLNLNLQARAIYSTDFSSMDHRGFVFNPKLSYSLEHVSALDLGVSTSIGPLFGSERLMDYFYEVKPRYATSSRPAYDADAGYLGTNVTLGITKRFDRSFRLVVGTRLGVHNGATNDDSPLFKDNVNVSVFTAFAWTFFQSEERAR